MLLSCKDSVVKEPDNLLEEDQMVNIIYDLSLLDAMKAQGLESQQKYPSTTEFLKKKYKIDSITFARNTQFYASDIKNYKKMYDKVKERLKEESTKLNGGKPQILNEEQGVVK